MERQRHAIGSARFGVVGGMSVIPCQQRRKRFVLVAENDHFGQFYVELLGDFGKKLVRQFHRNVGMLQTHGDGLRFGFAYQYRCVPIAVYLLE